MKVQMGDGAVPFVLSYRKILRRPKLKRERKFVGAVQVVKNLLYKAIEVIDDVCYTTETEVVDAGRTASVHWAVNIPDPFDIPPGQEVPLVAYRMAGDMPPCGAHFEIISPPRQEYEEEPVSEPESSVSHEEHAGRNGSSFRRPEHPAYGPRPVEPLPIDEPPDAVILSDVMPGGIDLDEIAARVDRASTLGEDD